MDASAASPAALIYLAVEWTIRVAMLIVVPFRRSPDAARGWLLVAFFLPVPALVLYLLIGSPSYPRWRRRRSARARKLIIDVTRKITASPHCYSPALPVSLSPAALLIERLGQFPTLGGNALELLADYDGVIDRLVADIDGATDHVHLLTYIFADDPTARRVIDALARAARRGVSCRVLIDAIGSRPWARRVHRLLAARGVEIASALPVPLLRRRSARADLRNHRKIVVVDARIGYIGSQNIVGAQTSPGVFNKELVVRVDGPVALELQAVFAADWFLETGRILDAPKFFEHEHTAGGAVAQVLASGPDHPVAGAGRLVVALAHGARRRIVITTPYFIPDEPLLQALETAVLRGVDVRLIVSRVCDNMLVSLAQRSYYEELLSAGVAIHLYRDGLLHAKHISVDNDISLVGSSNIDVRSFRLNAEAGLVVYDRDVTARLRSEQDRDLAASDQLVHAIWARRPFWAKLGENVARLMSPLL